MGIISFFSGLFGGGKEDLVELTKVEEPPKTPMQIFNELRKGNTDLTVESPEGGPAGNTGRDWRATSTSGPDIMKQPWERT